MNPSVLQPPGVRFVAARPAPEPSPLRSDIAAFVGPTRRGPIGQAVRIEGWREYLGLYGGLDRRYHTPYAVRGYFENGGQTAYIVRVAGGAPGTGHGAWRPPVPLWGLPADGFELEATSPGAWSDGVRVELSWRREGPTYQPEIDLAVRLRDEADEVLVRIPAGRFAEELARRSALVWARPLGDLAPPGVPSPRLYRGPSVLLTGAVAETAPQTGDYLAAIDRLTDEPDVALTALPDLHADADDDELDRVEIVAALLAQAELLRDRLVIVDLPCRDPADGVPWHADTLITWLDGAIGLGRDRDQLDQRPWRAGAAYHPWIRVDDPLGGAQHPLRTIPPSGHVAGMISALDRSRGAHHTPANEPLIGVLDLEDELTSAEHAAVNQDGINLLRCVPGLGYAVMGGRTLDPRADQRWVAHRRLLHRLVRAIRRVAEPLVFENNEPALWFQFVRAVTSVLVEAWRSGALKGARAEEAFTVQCDGETNPPEEVDLGRCLCRIAVAPAVPMEFIELRVALSRDGSLEVLS